MRSGTPPHAWQAAADRGGSEVLSAWAPRPVAGAQSAAASVRLLDSTRAAAFSPSCAAAAPFAAGSVGLLFRSRSTADGAAARRRLGLPSPDPGSRHSPTLANQSETSMASPRPYASCVALAVPSPANTDHMRRVERACSRSATSEACSRNVARPARVHRCHARGWPGAKMCTPCVAKRAAPSVSSPKKTWRRAGSNGTRCSTSAR